MGPHTCGGRRRKVLRTEIAGEGDEGRQEGECTQIMRIILSRGIGGIDERTRGFTQRWFDMVDWRSAHVGSAILGVSRIIEGYAQKLEGEVRQQHPFAPG